MGCFYHSFVLFKTWSSSEWRFIYIHLSRFTIFTGCLWCTFFQTFVVNSMCLVYKFLECIIQVKLLSIFFSLCKGFHNLFSFTPINIRRRYLTDQIIIVLQIFFATSHVFNSFEVRWTFPHIKWLSSSLLKAFLLLLVHRFLAVERCCTRSHRINFIPWIREIGWMYTS